MLEPPTVASVVTLQTVVGLVAMIDAQISRGSVSSSTSPITGDLTRLKPERTELPSTWAARLAEWAADTSSRDYRKAIGQFFTPLPVARYIAQLAKAKSEVRILDPGCGTAVLSCALIEALLASRKCRSISLVAYDTDSRMVKLAGHTLKRAEKLCSLKGVSMQFRVEKTDFTQLSKSLMRGKIDFGKGEGHLFDITVCNPPYIKLRKSDELAAVANWLGAGTSNTYALFMMLSAYLLKERGQLLFITPRSFCSGQYFARFRREFFRIMQPSHIHVFESRTDTFSSDAVLQESIILKAEKVGGLARIETPVFISASHGKEDVLGAPVRPVPLNVVVDKRSPIAPLRIPTSTIDEAVLVVVDAWPRRLGNTGLRVSTGPVVPFRSRQHLKQHSVVEEGKGVPLIWGHNITAMSVRWPSPNRSGKPQAVANEADRDGLLVPMATYVLVRRFSPKEEERRIIASVLEPSDFTGMTHVGLENHVNYIYKYRANLDLSEAIGLSLLLNSSLMDRYFRILNGNTQVSATELRSLPLPAANVLEEMGQQWLLRKRTTSRNGIDEFVFEALGLPKDLRSSLTGA